MSQQPTHADQWAESEFVRPVSRTTTRADGVPDWIGPYRVLRVLGQGAAGLVVLAERDDRQVAVKVLLDQNAEAQGRFLVETRVASKLRDPGLVAILDVGSHEGHPFYAMEYCPGVTLQERLRSRGAMAPLDAARLLRDLARALGVAHAERILHRDLKPANIILEAPSGRPRITDFGVARDRSEVGGLTRSHDVLGTPLYMAPETFEGSKFVDERSDVYALGVILYECLTGRRPYVGDTVLELAKWIRKGDAAPVRVLNPDVPRRLEAVCMRAMARDPDARYLNAGALQAALDAFLADPRGSDTGLRPVAPQRARSGRAAPAAPAPAAVRVPRITPTTVVLGALAASCLLLLGSTLWAVSRRGDEPREAAPAEAAAAPAEAPSAPAGVDFAAALSACREQLDAPSLADWESALEAAQQAVAGPRDQAELEALLEAAFVERHDALAAAMRAPAPYDGELTQRADRLARQFPTRCGDALLLLGDYHRRRARYGDGIRCAERLLSEAPPEFAAEARRLELLCHWRRGTDWRGALQALVGQAGTPGGYYGRGVQAFIGGNTGGAIDAADRCLQLDPDYVCAKILRVWALGYSGNVKQAASYEATFAAEAADDPYLLIERMRRELEDGFHHQALVTAQQLSVLLDGHDPEARTYLQRIDAMMRDVRRANLEATRLLNQAPGDQALLLRRGITALILGELDHAAGDAREAKRLNPQRFEAMVADAKGLTDAERAWLLEAGR